MSSISWWEVNQAVRTARDAETEAANTYDRRLTELLEEYAGRRSAAAQLVRDVADLAVGYAAESDRRAHAAIEAATGGQQVAFERLEQQLEKSRDHAKWLRAELDEKRRLTEERDAQGEEVQVTIGRSQGGWKVADLEEVAYRLRCGGAVDETPVKVAEWKMSALVPAPNMVPRSPALAPCRLLRLGLLRCRIRWWSRRRGGHRCDRWRCWSRWCSWRCWSGR